MNKTVVIAAAVLLALLTAAGIILVTNKKDSSPAGGTTPPNVRLMEDNISANGPADDAMLHQIAELKAMVEQLEKEKGQAEFDRDALKAEQDKLNKRISELETQEKYLRDRNTELTEEEQQLYNKISEKEKEIAAKETEIATFQTAIAARETALAEAQAEIAALNQQVAKLSQELSNRDQLVAALNNKIGELSDIIINDVDAYYRALDTIAEQRESLRRKDAVLASAETTGTLHVTKGGELVNTFSVLPPGQAKNTVGIRIGDRDFNLEGSLALMPHWFLMGNIGGTEVPDDFVLEEIPGYDANHAFFYDALVGTGLNWRFNKIQCQPNIYINTAVGPAWFLYRKDGDVDMKTYLLWRSSIGFDLTLHKHLQFTGDIGVNWLQDYGFSPRFTLGVVWNFSNTWAIVGKK